MSPHFLCWQKPLPISSTDEERQLQLALALSKEEHEKVPVPCSPRRSSLLALWASFWGAGAQNAASLRFLLRFHCCGLPAELAPGGASARMLGPFGDAAAAPVLVCLLEKVLHAGLELMGLSLVSHRR